MKDVCDDGRGVGPRGLGVYLDFADAMARIGLPVVHERYGNSFEMYERITGEDPYRVPMRIYPAIHYTMGGLWVDYDLMSTIPGLFALGEANFSDHGANRLGASALMQGLADGSLRGTATCQLHMRHFRDGATITLEPWRATAFPIVKDLVVDRSALDRIVASGGFISAHAGAAPEANAILVPRDDAEDAMDAAACIGCGACVAACPNGSASLFTASKITASRPAPARTARTWSTGSPHGPANGRRRLRWLHMAR